VGRDPEAALGHAPAEHPRPLLLGDRVQTLLCPGSGLPMFFLLSAAHAHDAPFAQPLLVWAKRLYQIPARLIRLDAASWGLGLIMWIHTVLGASAGIACNPTRQKHRSCLPATWTKEELGKRSASERFFGRVFLFVHLHRPARCGWSALASQLAFTSTACVSVGLAAQQAGRSDLIRSPRRVLAPLCREDSQLGNALRFVSKVRESLRKLRGNLMDVSTHCLVVTALTTPVRARSSPGRTGVINRAISSKACA
jgi:hypothetical protein